MRKKMFLTLCLSISAILLLSYCLIYVTFRSLLRNEIQEKQQYILDFNETVFTNYIDSFNLIPFQLVDNHEIGSALNTSSSDYLDMFRAREALKKEFNKYLKLLVFTSNLDGRLILYLNKNIPLSAYCDSASLSKDVSLKSIQIYADTKVKDEKWYQRAASHKYSPYFFLNESTNEICFAKCAQSYYLYPPSAEGIGLVVISIPTASILEKLMMKSITPNSSIILMNEYHEILYQHGSTVPADAVTLFSSQSSELLLDGHKYLVNTASVKNNLYLTFLTPYSDIETVIRSSLRPYIAFSLITFVVLILILYVLSRKITAPIISFADLLSKIEDTRTFNPELLTHYKDAELVRLCNSFQNLISRENSLIARIDEENKAKRAAVLHALQAQINPHFLYNALDVVSWMALSKREDAIADVVSSISNMMHYSISHPDALVALPSELDNIQEFIRIFQLERPTKIYLTISSKNDLNPADIKIPKFTLHPLVENAVLHNPDKSCLHIEIEIALRSNLLSISVVDDGIGADPQKLNAYLNYEETDLAVSNGFGIRNVNERLQMHYPEIGSLSYSKSPSGRLTATLIISLESNGEK